jgi:hypothetical protein
MHQDPQNRRFSSSNKIRHLIFDMEHTQQSRVEYAPFFYAEVRIDFNDIRTGFRSTVSINKAVEILPVTPDFLWADDMVRDIDPDRTEPPLTEAEFIELLPDFVDANFMSQMETQFIHYLLRSYKVKVYRNYELDTYSLSGESLSEFSARCLDLLGESRRLESDALHEVFNRRLEQIREKYLNVDSFDSLDVARAESHDRDLFWSYSDWIADLFLQPDVSLSATMNERRLLGSNTDLEDRLASLKFEAHQAVAKIWDSYKQKARSMDEYILHPNLKDIHFVRCCILWIPARAA